MLVLTDHRSTAGKASQDLRLLSRAHQAFGKKCSPSFLLLQTEPCHRDPAWKKQALKQSFLSPPNGTEGSLQNSEVVGKGKD
jgi:hypothetical protein